MYGLAIPLITKINMIIKGGQTGETVENGKILAKQYQPIDTDTLEYCWKHPNTTLTSDWKNPNPEDKKKLDKIKLEHREMKEKDGTISKFRICPKCYNFISYTKIP